MSKKPKFAIQHKTLKTYPYMDEGGDFLTDGTELPIPSFATRAAAQEILDMSESFFDDDKEYPASEFEVVEL